MLHRLLLPLVLLASACFGGTAAPAPQARHYGGASPLEWSQRLADSEMKRLGNRLELDKNPKARWDYSSSLFCLSLWKLGEKTGAAGYQDFASRAIGSFVDAKGDIATYKLEDYNIDAVCPGKVFLEMYAKNGDARLKAAADLLRNQMRTHPRTSEGGFWHKKRYPNQMWLDGLYMGSPYLSRYAQLFHEDELFRDVALQFILIDRHLYDAKTGLYYHAWDELHTQPWANPKTGLSPNFWSRSIGWYAMALVDVLDTLPATQENVDDLVHILRKVADGIAKYQDPESGLWWQVTDAGPRKGNYLEATASSMFVYALAKGINHGYLPRDVYEPVVLRGYEGIVRRLLRTDADGSVSLTQCCAVAGLGLTTQNGRPRDGSFDYYISEPIVDNDHKGVGPFILAGIELDQLAHTQPAQVVERVTGWDYAERILARIKAPSFPDREYPITNYGAKADGSECTEAIAKAIADCSAAGGGHVVVPAGTWSTAAIHLRSNVDLHLADGAILRFLFAPEKYPIVRTRWEGVELMGYSAFIYAYGQENIAVTGNGTLDGGANYETWWGWNAKHNGAVMQKAARNRLIDMAERNVPVEQRVFGKDSFLRPNFFQPYCCKNILISDVTIINSPMWEIHPVLSSNITVRGVKIASHGPNNDGCDPESSRDILIENCVFDTGDDCIAIKSGRNTDGRRVNVPSENIIIRNCTMKDGHGGVVIGSEISGGCRNVFAENCVMDSVNLDRGLRLKSNAVRGGFIENIFMRKVTIGSVKEAVLTVDLLYEEGAKGDFPPVIRNVNIEDTNSSASPRVMYIRGFKGATIDGIRFENCRFSGVKETDVINNAGLITLRNVTVVPAKLSKSVNSNEP